MKKTIVLLTIVLAIIAAPVFAETGFSGSVEYKYGTDFDQFKTGTGNDTAISLDGMVGEFSTISVGIEADGDSNAKATLMTLTQDVTGALGIDGPVSFKYKMGKQTYSPADYSGVAGYKDTGADAKIGQSWEADGTDWTTGSLLGTVLTFGFADMIMLDVAVYPGSYFEKAADPTNGYMSADTYTEFGVNAYGTFGPAQVSVYFVGSPANYFHTDDEGDAIDENGKMIGANLGFVQDALSVGFLWETDLENEYFNGVGSADSPQFTELGLAAQYVVGPVTPGVALFGGMTKDVDMEFADDFGFGLNVTFAAAEALNITAAMNSKFNFDELNYEAGLDYTLDGVKYSIGYTKDSEFAGYDAEFVDGADSIGNMYVKVSASF